MPVDGGDGGIRISLLTFIAFTLAFAYLFSNSGDLARGIFAEASNVVSKEAPLKLTDDLMLSEPPKLHHLEGSKAGQPHSASPTTTKNVLPQKLQHDTLPPAPLASPSAQVSQKLPSLLARPPCPTREEPVRVLVTGITGMIGSHVARELVKKPCYEVYGLVRPRSNLDTLVGILHLVKLITGDLSDAHRMEDVVAEVKPQYLYHFGAQAINGISYANADITVDVNVRGTLNLLEGVRRAGLGGVTNPHPTRVLLAGSSTEYGRTVDEWDGPVPEHAPLQPVTPYGVSKVATELLGNQYNSSFGIPSITARFFIQVGVGGTDSLAIHQFCKQIALAEVGLQKPILEHGNIATSRDMTDAIDSARVIVSLAEIGKPGEAYNIGSGYAMGISDLLAIAIAQSRVPIETRIDATRLRAYDEKVLLPDISKIKKLTGWEPAPNMTQTVSNILGYWRARVKQLYLRSGPGEEL